MLDEHKPIPKRGWPNKFVSPKGGGGWVVKPQYEDKSYEFVDELMAALVAFKRGDIEVLPLPQPPHVISQPYPSHIQHIQDHTATIK